ncbi:Hypothetical predicted protein [Cloeon dipterum]|uniref:Uncharacterized protein n=1 Tax=Cloeon dipterum TaxID=197152 RepID=A0A8S1E3Z3_9INSE|nr:Hypothetical predicted protein [Cloeon dipterum]
MDIKPVKYHPSDKDRVCVKFRVHDICRASRLFVSRFCCTRLSSALVTQEKEEIESKLKNDQKFRKAVVISLSGNSAIPNGVGTILKRRL